MSESFKAGDAVIVDKRYPPGHIRTPFYLRGKKGIVLRSYGAFRNPEELAYGKPGLPEKVLYQVQFSMDEVWHGDGSYAPADTITADIYEHWLQPDASTARSA